MFRWDNEWKQVENSEEITKNEREKSEGLKRREISGQEEDKRQKESEKR